MNLSKTRDVTQKLRRVDVVFVMDTTGSMSPYIAEARKRLHEFSRKLVSSEVKPDVAFGTVAYRDHPPEDSSYVAMVYALEEDVAKAHANISKLTADGGGDGPEAVLDGLNAGLTSMGWREFAHKVLLLVGDAPPHGAGDSGDHWPGGCPCGLTAAIVTQQAQKLKATIHAVGVGSDVAMAQSFRSIAKASGGEYVQLSDVNALIDRILALLRTELGKMATDIDVFGAWTATPDASAGDLATAVGKSDTEVNESLERLRAKGAISYDESVEAAFSRLAESSSASTSAPSSEIIDDDLLIRIKIGSEPELSDHSDSSAEIEIKLLDH